MSKEKMLAMLEAAAQMGDVIERVTVLADSLDELEGEYEVQLPVGRPSAFCRFGDLLRTTEARLIEALNAEWAEWEGGRHNGN